MKNKSNILNALASAFLAVGIFAAAPANATVTEGDASAYVIQATVFDNPLIGPAPYASVIGNGTDTQSISSINLNDSLVRLNTGLLNAQSSSNVDGSSGFKTATASSSIADVDFDVAQLAGLSFDLISSSSTVTGDAGSFSAIGNSSIVGLTGYGLLSGLNSIEITGAPNQTLLSVFGIEVIANRQVSTCTAVDCFITTDALYVDVAGVKNLTLASSSAHLAAPVPEPETVAMMLLGLAGLAGSKRVRNKVRIAA
ncbi:MAG TPA: PEP-CTERM sorting domain-containing protein [Methylophilaceae bacterium]|nr:PEP-CTERM sorting domain-containing protein [Methylophilaceae bacterium]